MNDELMSDEKIHIDGDRCQHIGLRVSELFNELESEPHYTFHVCVTILAWLCIQQKDPEKSCQLATANLRNAIERMSKSTKNEQSKNFH